MKQKKLFLVVTVQSNGDDDIFGDVIGVYDDFEEAIKIRDKVIAREPIDYLDYNMLAPFDTAAAISRDMNKNIENSLEKINGSR